MKHENELWALVSVSNTVFVITDLPNCLEGGITVCILQVRKWRLKKLQVPDLKPGREEWETRSHSRLCLCTMIRYSQI